MPGRSVSVSLGANPAGFIAGMRAAGTSAEGLEAKTAGLGRNLKLLGTAFVGVELVKGLTDAAKAAGEFQEKTNVLVTAAGESQKNLAGVQAGITNVAIATGTAWQDVAAATYTAEKASYRGADALKIVKAAAQGAREENADLATVTNAVTSIMASYHLKAGDAVSVTNQLKAAAGESKTTMEAFSGSLSTVLPVASANKIAFADVAGSLATLTQHGTSADEAAQELSNTIRGLSAPNAVAVKEMGQLGISSQDVSQKLGDGPGGRGLAGTLNYLSESVLTKMGPSGKLLLNTFNQSQAAAAAATTEISKMPPQVQALAKQYASGTISLADWRSGLKGLPADQAALGQQFATTENQAKGFNSAIRAGLPGSQTYTQAIKAMTGGANGLNTTLQLTGESTAGTTERIKVISEASKNAGADVSGWGITQKNLNTQLASAKQSLEAVQRVIGAELLPVGVKFAGWVRNVAEWLAKYPKIVKDVAIALAGAGGLTVAWKAVNAVMGIYQGLAARTMALRGANVLAIRAETAAAEQGVLAMRGLTAAESTVGLRAPLGNALGRLGLAGAAATGGETAAIGAAGALTVGGALAIGGALTVAGAATFASVKIANWAYNSTPAATQQNAGSAPMGGGPGGTLTKDQQSGYGAQYMAAAGFNPDGSPLTQYGSDVKSASDSLLSYKAAEDAATAASDRQSNAIHGLDNDSAKLSVTLKHQAENTKVTSGVIVNLTTHLGAIAQGLENAKDKAKGFAAGLALLSDNAIGASRAEDGFQQQINNLAASIDKHSKTLKGNSNAAIQNRGLLDELASANNQAATAVLKQTGSVSKARKVLHDNAVELERNATATFGSRDAADAFLKTIGALPSQVDAAFAGLHQTGLTYGGQLVDGFAGGIQQHTGDALDAAKIMVNKTATVIRAGLKIQSPSKVTHEYGGHVATGFANGIKDSTHKATAAAKKLAAAAAKALREATTAERRSISLEIRGWLADVNKDIATTKASISKDRSALESWRSNQDQAKANAKGVFTATGDLSNITGATIKNWDGTTGTAPVTFSDITGGLRTASAKDKMFLADLKRLKKAKVSPSILTQILNMGPEAGDEYAKAILGTDNGKSEVGQINGLEKGIGQYGNDAAKMAAEPFQKHIDGLKKSIDGLTDHLKKETAARDKAKTLSLTINSSDTQAQLKQIEAAVEKALGIKLHLKSVGG